MLICESRFGLFVINHHCLRFIDLWRAGRTQRHETWFVEYKCRPNAAPKMLSQSVRWGRYNTGCKLRKALPAICAIDLKFFIHVLLIVLYNKASCTMTAAMTNFLLICITFRTVKWIELLKDWLYQHQIWYTALGDEQTNFYYKWARLVKKHGRQGPMYFCNGRGSEMIGHNSHTLVLSSQNLVGRFTTGLVICLPKHVELNL